MCVCNSCVCSVRCESAGRDRERSKAAGSKWPGESLSIDQLTQVSTDGRSGGTEPPYHYIRLHTGIFINLQVSIFSSLSGHIHAGCSYLLSFSQARRIRCVCIILPG